MRKLANAELNRISKEAFAEAKKTPLIIVLDDIRSLHNIGSVFRTSDAFLIEKIYLCGITAVPPNKEIHKTALGATDTVTWEYAKNVLEVGIYNGGSIKLWNDFFTNATVYGLDIIDSDKVWDAIKNNEKIILHTSSDAYNNDFFNTNFLKSSTISLVIQPSPT